MLMVVGIFIYVIYSNYYVQVQFSVLGGSLVLVFIYYVGGIFGGEFFFDDIVLIGWDY